MIDPHTGEILAMASVPGYNPNKSLRRGGAGRAQPGHHRRLRARVHHENGDLLAAFDAGKLRPDDRFDC